MNIQQAIEYLNSIPDNQNNIKLNSGELIVNMKKFKDSHIERLKHARTEGLVYSSTLDRVIQLSKVLKI